MSPTVPTDLLITVSVGVVMILGLIGIVAPVLPGLGMMWAAGLAYGVLIGWGSWGPWLFALMTLFTVIGFLADVGMSAAGAKVRGASLWSVAAGLALGVLGLILFSLLGAVAGLLLGVFLAEYRRVHDTRKALDSMVGMGVGYGLSYGVKLLMGLADFGLWLVWMATMRA